MRNGFTWFDYIFHAFFLTIYGLVKYFPSPVGDILRFGILRFSLNRVRFVRIYEGVTFWYPYRIKIGNGVTINENVYLNGYAGLDIGNNVLIGRGSSFYTSNHIFTDPDKPIRAQGIRGLPVSVEDDVWVGANAIILGGVRIGRGSVLAAGCVVTKDVPPYSVVAGVPAKIISKRKL